MEKKKKIYLLLLVLVFAVTFVLQEFRIAGQRHCLLEKQADIEIEMQTLENRLDQLVSDNSRSFVNSQKVPLPVTFCGDTLDMASPFIRERVEREFYSLLGNQGQLQLYLKRTQRYLPMIEQYLSKSQLPEDLKYLSVHESALLPKIRSRSNAVGLWQFMYHTGRLYKLKINRYIDERRDPERATAAATRFLKDLYRQFGKWPLVLAAYNGGQGRISRNIKKQNSTDLIDLSLPEETERYYFKIVATKIIVSNPEKFGFKFEVEDFFSTPEIIKFEYTINENRQSLEEIASLFDMSIVALKEYNPELINSHLINGTYILKIPVENHLRYIEDETDGEIEESLTLSDKSDLIEKTSQNPESM